VVGLLRTMAVDDDDVVSHIVVTVVAVVGDEPENNNVVVTHPITVHVRFFGDVVLGHRVCRVTRRHNKKVIKKCRFFAVILS
jgi:hypothetical protein